MGKNYKWNYLFVCSNIPSPRSMEKVKHIVNSNRKVALIYMARPTILIKMETIEGCDIIKYKAKFRKVDFWRIITFFRLIFWFRFKIFRLTCKNSDIYLDSLDLLAAAQIASIGKTFRFRYEVRDLNSIQIDKGILSKGIRMIESFFLKKVNMLVLTCDEYYKYYYKYFYKGKHILVENWPALQIFKDFIRDENNGEFIIGYIGVIRYLPCISSLITAVEYLRRHGLNIKIKFAGGGDIDIVKKLFPESVKNCAVFIGSFNYEEEITKLYKNIDLNFAVYDVSVKNVRYAMPNKYYESILTGIPIIVSEGTFLQKKVKETGIGTSVNCRDKKKMVKKIRDAYFNRGWYKNALETIKSVDIPKETELVKKIDIALMS